MKILIIGSGGREHALAWGCAHSRLNPQITCLPGNGGTARLARNVDIKAEDIAGIAEFVRAQRFDLLIVGPEAPLVAGLADLVAEYGCPVFGPTKAAARLEGSKAYAKQVMTESGVPTAEYSVFSDFETVKAFIHSRGAPLVVKASGLAAGKGVLVCNTEAEAVAAAEAMLLRDVFGSAGHEIIVEEVLAGRELSLLALVDGEDLLLLPASRDHKRAFDNDQGPNTGGMGAYAPLPELSRADIRLMAMATIVPVVKKLAADGAPFRGCLYAGLMMTDSGVKVLEYNCRFGDPETQAIIPLLSLDILELMAEVAEGNLKHWLKANRCDPLDCSKTIVAGHAVTVVAAMDGYPDKYPTGVEIKALPDDDDNLIVFHAGTTLKDDKFYTSGGRVVAVTGLGNTHQDAVARAYKGAHTIKFNGCRFRRDIGGGVS